MVFDPLKHPRGRDGRFIEVGSLVRFLFNGKDERAGRVMGIDTSGRVRVRTRQGEEHLLIPDQVLRTVREKGRLETDTPPVYDGADDRADTPGAVPLTPGTDLAARLARESASGHAWSRTDLGRGGAGPGPESAVARYDLDPGLADELTRAGHTSLPVWELPSTPEGALAFHNAVAEARDTSKFGTSVTVYPPEDYTGPGIRLFLLDGGRAGVAVKDDGQIVSVFNADPTVKGPLYTLIPLALSQGGTRADCFDTVLPGLYAPFGLDARARTPFVDEFAPDGWDYELYGAFNGGRPDVVFLRYDPEKVGHPYVQGSGTVVEEYDDGLIATLPDVPEAAAPDQSNPWRVDSPRAVERVQYEQRLKATRGSTATEDLAASKAAREAADAALSQLPDNPSHIGRRVEDQSPQDRLYGFTEYSANVAKHLDERIQAYRSFAAFFDSLHGRDSDRLVPPTPEDIAWLRANLPESFKNFKKALGTESPRTIKRMTVLDFKDREEKLNYEHPYTLMSGVEETISYDLAQALQSDGRELRFLTEEARASWDGTPTLDADVGTGTGQTRRTAFGAVPAFDWDKGPGVFVKTDRANQRDNELIKVMAAEAGWERDFIDEHRYSDVYVSDLERDLAWADSPLTDEQREAIRRDFPMAAEWLGPRLDDPAMSHNELASRIRWRNQSSYHHDRVDLRAALEARDAWSAALPRTPTPTLDVDPVDQGPGHEATRHFDLIEQAGGAALDEISRRLVARGKGVDQLVQTESDRKALDEKNLRLIQIRMEFTERAAERWLIEQHGVEPGAWRRSPHYVASNMLKNLALDAEEARTGVRPMDYEGVQQPLYRAFEKWDYFQNGNTQIDLLQKQVNNLRRHEKAPVTEIHRERSIAVREVLMEMGVPFGVSEGEALPYVFEPIPNNPDLTAYQARVESGEEIKVRELWRGETPEPGRTESTRGQYKVLSIDPDTRTVTVQGFGDRTKTLRVSDVSFTDMEQDVWQARDAGNPIAARLIDSLGFIPRPMIDELMSAHRTGGRLEDPVWVNWGPLGTRASRGRDLTLDSSDTAWVYVHEEHHAVQQASEWVGTMEWAWRARAVTEGEIGSRTLRDGDDYALRSLKEIYPGASYDDHEVAFKDDSWDAYATKVYGGWRPPGGGSEQGRAHKTSELLTMIAQSLLVGDASQYRDGMTDLQLQRVQESERLYLGLVLQLQRAHARTMVEAAA